MSNQPKENLQGLVPGDHAERVRGTVAGMQRIIGAHYTLGQFLLDATREHCDRLEREHHDDQPWPPIPRGTLARGARVGRPDRRGIDDPSGLTSKPSEDAP